MPELTTGFQRPTLATLIARIQADLSSRTGDDAAIRGSLPWVLGRVLAGAAHMLHGHASWIADQVLVDTAEGDRLDRHGAIWGLPRTAATEATGSVVFTGVVATAIPAGTTIARTADGVTYTTDALGAIGGGGSVTLAVTASDAGDVGNTDGLTACDLVSPIAGVDTACAFDASGATGGDEIEADSAYRERLLTRIRETPQGGAEADYEAWAQAVSGVERAYVYPLEDGAGTVTVRVLASPTTGDSDELIPSAGLIASVLAALNLARPVTAIVTVPTLTSQTVDHTIELGTDTPAIRAAVEAELEAAFIARTEPGGTWRRSWSSEAISRATGEDWHALTVPAADVAATTADKVPILGAITWV